MVHSQIFPELVGYLKSFGFKKTLKAFKKEIHHVDVANHQNVLSPQQLIDCILTQRQSLCTEQENKKKQKPWTTHTDAPASVLNDFSPAASLPQRKNKLLNADVHEESTKKNKRKRLKTIQQTENKEKTYHDDIPTSNSPRMTPSQTTTRENVTQDLKVPLNLTLSPSSFSRSSSRCTSGSPLRRLNVRKSLESIKDPRLLQMSNTTISHQNSFIAKAAKDFQNVRGKDFRREMTKKKRASWRSFGIDEDQINSIQFHSD